MKFSQVFLKSFQVKTIVASNRLNFSVNSLRALSPLDGRYEKATDSLKDYFSESALMK